MCTVFVYLRIELSDRICKKDIFRVFLYSISKNYTNEKDILKHYHPDSLHRRF